MPASHPHPPTMRPTKVVPSVGDNHLASQHDNSGTIRMRMQDLARGESAGLVERQVPNGFSPIAFVLQGPAGMNGLLPAEADGHHRGPMLRGGFEVWSLSAYCSWRRSAASTAERPDGAGDDEQGREERGGSL
jgi:hypothetical protein